LTGLGVYHGVNPVDVAEQYATLDIVADDRFILGVGLGYRQQEYDVFGVERRTRARRFEEAIELLKRLWTEEPPSRIRRTSSRTASSPTRGRPGS
jgi:alkanesulfonate monooxygenase SsuD/methylene tetrahydromethanopterin reductase-like flavin-dependent oxidoreductase (luciferase family)